MQFLVVSFQFFVNYSATVVDQPVIVGTIQALGDATGVQPRPCSPADTLRRRHSVGEACFCRGALRGRSPCTREGRRPDRPYGSLPLAALANSGYAPGPKIFRFADPQANCYTAVSSKYHLRRRETVQRQERTMEKYKVSIEYCVQ